MIILCQCDYNERIEELVRLLRSTPPRIVQENSTPGYILYPIGKRRVKKKTATSPEPSLKEIRQDGCADLHYVAVLLNLSQAANISQQVQLRCLYF